MVSGLRIQSMYYMSKDRGTCLKQALEITLPPVAVPCCHKGHLCKGCAKHPTCHKNVSLHCLLKKQARVYFMWN